MYEQTNTMMETKTSFQIPQLLDGDNFTSEDLADDMEGLRLSFTRIKIPGGGHLQFEIPSGNPDVPDYAPYQAFLCDGMLEVDSTAFMDYMEENNLGYIVDYKRYDADVFTGVNRRTAAVFQFHSAALRRLNKVGCQRYEGDYTRLKQKHAERRARRMAG